MNTHTLKLHVENPGTRYLPSDKDGTRSIAGHVWFEVTYPSGKSLHSGFAPSVTKSGTKAVPVSVFTNDGKNYAGAPAFTAQFEITEAQARTLQQYSKDPLQFGFDKHNYHALTNSCVDFVWKALEQIGMNPQKKQGDVFPIDNIDDFMRLKNPATRPKASLPISLLSDAWDSLRTPAHFPILLPEVTFEEAPHGSIDVGALGAAQSIKAPNWPGFAYGDSMLTASGRNDASSSWLA